VFPQGEDPGTFYGGFAGKLTPSWTPAEGLVIWVAADSNIARLYAPIKSAMRFAPTGTSWGEVQLGADSLILNTWPTAYVSLKDALASAIPAQICLENVDPAEVLKAVKPLFIAMGRTEAAADAFMLGNGLLKVAAGTPLGAAAPMANGPAAATPNRVKITMTDGQGNSLNPLQFLDQVATLIGVDRAQHPLLSQMSLNNWLDLAVEDESGGPLAGEPYVLYLGDGSQRAGATDAKGRIYETGLPAGDWGLDLTNYPSFVFFE